MRGGLDWGLPPPDSVSTDPWSTSNFNQRDDTATVLAALAHLSGVTPPKPETQFSRADSIAFAEQYRNSTYEILSASETPLSTAQIHSLLSQSNPALVQLLDQRKSTSCMAKLLAEDPQHRFLKFLSVSHKKTTTCFGVLGKNYDSTSWTLKNDSGKDPNQNHRNDVEQTEKLRECVKSILINRGNKPLNTQQIAAIIKEENFDIAPILATKNKNYLVKTLRRDPKKRFIVTKGPAGSVSFTLDL